MDHEGGGDAVIGYCPKCEIRMLPITVADVEMGVPQEILQCPTCKSRWILEEFS